MLVWQALYQHFPSPTPTVPQVRDLSSLDGMKAQGSHVQPEAELAGTLSLLLHRVPASKFVTDDQGISGSEVGTPSAGHSISLASASMLRAL